MLNIINNTDFDRYVRSHYTKQFQTNLADVCIDYSSADMCWGSIITENMVLNFCYFADQKRYQEEDLSIKYSMLSFDKAFEDFSKQKATIKRALYWLKRCLGVPNPFKTMNFVCEYGNQLDVDSWEKHLDVDLDRFQLADELIKIYGDDGIFDLLEALSEDEIFRLAKLHRDTITDNLVEKEKEEEVEERNNQYDEF